MKKIAIVVPNTRWFDKRYFHMMPYTPCLLAAVVKSNYEVAIIDANINNLSEELLEEKIREFAPWVVGITSMSMEYAKSAHLAASIAKKAGVSYTVIGGIYPTLMPEKVMADQNIDFSVIGEGELRFPKLMKILEDGNDKVISELDGISWRQNDIVYINPKTEYVDELDNVPFPDYSLVDVDKYFHVVNKGSLVSYPKQYPYADTISARGCPYKCTFCSSQAINGRKIRYRSAENVLDEISMLVDKYGIRHINFNDDNFFLDKKRAKAIMQGLIDRKMGITWKTANAAVYALDNEMIDLIVASGGYQIFLAIESGSQDVLRDLIKKPLNLDIVPGIVKKCKEAGLLTCAMFIIGMPGETWEQIRQTFRYAEDLDLDYAMFSIATPLPCTEMLETARSKGYLPADTDYDNLEFFGFGRANITTDEFTPFELQVLRAFEWDRINFTSQDKKEKIAFMLGINMEELEMLRRNTRISTGMATV